MTNLHPMDHRDDLRSLRANGRRGLKRIAGCKSAGEEGIARVTAPEDLGIEHVMERVEAKGFKANFEKKTRGQNQVATN